MQSLNAPPPPRNKICISVVIPVYNAEGYLAKCLEHVVRQTHKTLEIIIVNDGSTDGSAAICKRYAKLDRRIKTVVQSNLGPASARNSGLARATGDYVHFHDSDDFVELDYYERMARVAGLTNADVICGEVVEAGFNFPRFDCVEILTSFEEKIAKTRANKFGPAWRYIFKREFLASHRLAFPKGVFCGEDLIFATKAIFHSETMATAPGAAYHVITSNPASLGKRIKEIVAKRGNGESAWAEFRRFMEKSGASRLFARDRIDPPLKVSRVEFLHMPILTKKVFDNKTKYYLFGMYVFRTTAG